MTFIMLLCYCFLDDATRCVCVCVCARKGRREVLWIALASGFLRAVLRRVSGVRVFIVVVFGKVGVHYLNHRL